MTIEPANPPAPTTYPDAVVAGARARYETSHGGRLGPWESLSEKMRASECRAFAAGLEAMWQDISSAPRNEYVLVALPGVEMPLIYGLLEFDGDPDPPRWYSAEDSVASPLDVDPTHWMPLPQPRTAGDAA